MHIEVYITALDLYSNECIAKSKDFQEAKKTRGRTMKPKFNHRFIVSANK